LLHLIPVTLLYGGLNALFVLFLGLNVSRLRATSVGVTKPLPPELVRPVRAHGNAAEWVPLALFLLLALELSGAANALALHLFGGLLLLARVLHAAGVYRRSRLQVAGATLNYLVVLAMAVRAVAAHFSR